MDFLIFCIDPKSEALFRLEKGTVVVYKIGGDWSTVPLGVSGIGRADPEFCLVAGGECGRGNVARPICRTGKGRTSGGRVALVSSLLLEIERGLCPLGRLQGIFSSFARSIAAKKARLFKGVDGSRLGREGLLLSRFTVSSCSFSCLKLHDRSGGTFGDEVCQFTKDRWLAA